MYLHNRSTLVRVSQLINIKQMQILCSANIKCNLQWRNISPTLNKCPVHMKQLKGNVSNVKQEKGSNTLIMKN